MSDERGLPESIQTIPEAIAYWAAQTPDAPALRASDGQALSFRELQEAVGRVASRLAALGIGREDRVALVLPPGFDTCLALLGTTARAVAVPFNPTLAAPELCRDLERVGARMVVTGGAPDERSRGVAGKLGIPTIGVKALAALDAHLNASPIPMGEGPLPDSIAAILHTSGTTGFPKRVPRPHRTFVAGARAARHCSNLTRDDVLLLTTSLHTNAGFVNLCAALCNGGSCVAMPGLDPAAYPRWLEEHQPTWLISNATELNLIIAAAARAGREFIAGANTRLRLVRAGALPMTPGTAERAEESLGALVFDGFGMTEASYVTGSGPGPLDRRAGSCGPPLNSEIRILDEQGQDLPPGTPGEVVIRGETLFPGYLDDSLANAEAFLPGGWFRTGDLGYLDDDGYLYVNGRLNELINRGGEKIAPVEVDRALQSHPAVIDAATFAVPDARFGEDIVAAVVVKEGMTAPARELRGWLLDRLAPFKVPKRVWIVESLPRTASGKVQRRVLAERFGSRES